MPDWVSLSITIGVALVLLVFWVIQFAQLMVLSDRDFPGRHDKVMWVVAFIVLNFFAAFVFIWWKTIMLSIRAAEREK